MPSPEAAIDLALLRQRGLVTHDSGRSAVAEDFRIIKRPLLQDALSRPRGNLIVVTSALPGEGKTFCAVNLAMSIAMEKDVTVLLVDADVARPSVPRVLGIAAGAGLLDVLLDDSLDLSGVILRTNVPSLSILPSGHANRHATELLASRSMSRLLEEIASRYADRVVIFDSPPLLNTSEASVLAAQMGQVVLVVEAERTPQNAVRDALRRLGPGHSVNLVYNKSQAFPGTQYYGAT